jgi:hypothetical protein
MQAWAEPTRVAGAVGVGETNARMALQDDVIQESVGI